jgi:hypothetical protein
MMDDGGDGVILHFTVGPVEFGFGFGFCMGDFGRI